MPLIKIKSISKYLLIIFYALSLHNLALASLDRGSSFAKQSNHAVKLQRSIGDYTQFAINLGVLAIISTKGDLEGLRQYSFSTATTMLITQGLKYSVNRTRPGGGNHSFPSGHAAFAFAPAAFLYERYGLKYALPAYLVAGFVAYSRVISSSETTASHFVSDVLSSAILATLSAKIFTKSYTTSKGKDYKLSFIPDLSFTNLYLGFNFNF